MSAPSLPKFIRDNTEEILSEWETFARSLPIGSTMDIVALRDHAKQMLKVIARDLETPQTGQQQADKARGKSDTLDGGPDSAAQEHGAGRAESGFSVEEMVAEFRALRASVIRLWTRQKRDASADDLEEMTRFNESIDQAIAESITRYTEDIGQSKERFLAILGHDLRTPLGAIMTSTRFMLDTGELGEPFLTLVTRMASSAHRMNHMVADLLDFTSTRFGDSFPITPGEMDVGNVIRDVVAEILASHPDRNIRIDSSGDLAGQWDSARLSQAFTNIIGNAVDHGSERDPIDVVVRGTRNEVTVTVQNRGPAIPEDRLAKIFDAMTTGGTETEGEKRHLGLGLYIVDKIVTAHGGTIAVQSTKKDGTTFSIKLPRRA